MYSLTSDDALGKPSIKDTLGTLGGNLNIIFVLDDIKSINSKLKIVDGKEKSYKAVYFQISFWYYKKAIVLYSINIIYITYDL